MVRIASLQSREQEAAVPKEVDYFMKQFEGHTTFVGATKSGIFTNYPGNINEKYGELQNLNDLGHSIYFTVNETKPEGRKKAQIRQIRAIFADDDEPRKTPKKFNLAPSIIVQTSGADEKFKHQYYWLTNTDDGEEWELVMEGIVKTYDTDPGAKDLARILRVPGFMNHKYDPPSPCKMVQCNGKVYEWEDVLKAFPPIPKRERQTTAKVLSGDDFNEHAHYTAFLKAESIAPSLNALIAHWGHHYSSTKIRQKVDQLYQELDPILLTDHKDRYYAARGQVDKFIKSIKEAVAKMRAETIAPQGPVVQLRARVPDALQWDWSILQSNPIPEEAIPGPMLQAAKEIGDWTGVGQDPAILSAVFITSSLLSKNVIIHEIDDDLTTHCQSGICIVMDTGARKSSIYNQMNKPFFEYEEQIKEEWEAVRHHNASRVKTLTSELLKKRKAYDKKDDHSEAEFEFHIQECGDLEQRLSQIPTQEPWLRSSDVTEEKLVRKLYHNQGVMAVISDDARQVINNIKGKYSQSGSGDASGESVYINALTGSDILYERVGNEQDMHIRKPVLNALLFVQPDAALGLKNSDMFVPSGLAARLPMYFYPVSGADIVKNTNRRSITQNKMDAYYAKLRALCLRRIDNPLHIRLDESGMEACARMDQKFALLLETKWRGHYDKSNKLITLSLMYATCFASQEDPEFTVAFSNVKALNGTYVLPVRYINAGFMFAEALFSQSISSHQQIAYESLPRKAESFMSTLQKWYGAGKIWEGFVQCGAFNNHVSVPLREHMPDIIDLLVEKGWLLPVKMTDEKRKLNGGFPDKLVATGDIVYHLNVDGIKRREELGLDQIESNMIGYANG